MISTEPDIAALPGMMAQELLRVLTVRMKSKAAFHLIKVDQTLL